MPLEKEYITRSFQETQKLAGEVLSNLEGKNVLLLEGELGAGKTTFCQGLLKTVGAEGPFTSPTFVIMKNYPLNNFRLADDLSLKAVYHFDCYRVDAEDVLELGWEEIAKNPQNIVLVEWPEKIKKIWPENYVKINFESLGENERRIKIIQ